MTGMLATLGYAAEGAYGAYAAPSRWIEFLTEGIDLQKGTYQSPALRGGGLFNRATRRVVTSRRGVAPHTAEWATKGMGLILSHAVGSTPVVSQLGGTAAHRQVHVPRSNGHNGMSLSMQKGVPDAAGTQKPFTAVGCKVTGWSLSVEPNGVLVGSWDIDARDVTTDHAYVEPSYVETELLSFAGAHLYLGGTVSTSGGVMSVSGGDEIDVTGTLTLTGDNALNIDKPKAGSLLKREPTHNGMKVYGGTLTTEFIDQATIYDLYDDDISTPLVARFVGSNIAGAYDNMLEVVYPSVKFEGETPKVGGPGDVAMSAGFTAFDNGTNPPVQFVIVSTDTAA